MVVLVMCALSTFSTATSVTIYTSRAAWTAATTGVTTADFNGIASVGSFVGYGSGPAVIDGLTFTSNDSMFVIDPAYYGFPYPDGFFNADYNVPNIVTIALPGSYNAVGFDFGSLFSGGASFDVTVGAIGPITVTSTGSTQDGVLGFAGFVSSTPFNTVTLSMPDAPTYNAVDNFSYGSSVPEPGSIALLGSGLLGVAGILRRRFTQ
jgi:hypothetical protein